MAQTLKGHVALVTGSTTGLGLGIAKVLGAGGAKVVMNYYNDEERAKRAFSEFQSAGGEGILLKANAIDELAIADLVDRAQSELGAIDIIVPNATPDQPLKTIEEYDWELYQTGIWPLMRSFFKSEGLLKFY